MWSIEKERTIDHLMSELLKQENRALLEFLGEGVLFPLNKPGKECNVKNTRAITLLNVSRKILSIVILERIYPDVEKYLSAGQCGFRRHRSAAEITWTYSWLESIAEKYKHIIHIMGIDMSKAFDTINRKTMLNVLKPIIKDSEHRLIRVLLANTTLRTRIKQHYGEKFTTVAGTPQGDGLSPILFIIYLENALRNLRASMDLQEICQNEQGLIKLYIELCYADDVDFVSTEKPTLDEIQDGAKIVFSGTNLQVNDDKTDFREIGDNRHSVKNFKKLGTKFIPEEALIYRMQQAYQGLRAMITIWKNKPDIVSVPTRIRLYNAYVQTILVFNLCSCPLTQSQVSRLDAFHRKQLRYILGYRYPDRITNAALYKNTNTERLSVKIQECRLHLFQRLLTLRQDTPANKIMDLYFDMKANHSDTKRGTARTSLHKLLQKDLSRVGCIFKTKSDLTFLRKLTPLQWKHLKKYIMESIRDEWKNQDDEIIRQRAEKNKDKINPDTTGQPAHKRAKIPRSNKRTIEDTQLYTYSLSDVRKAAEEEIRQMKKKRRLQNDAQMTQDPNTNSHIRIEIT